MNFQIKLIGAKTLYSPKLGETPKDRNISSEEAPRIVTKAVADSLRSLTYVDGNGNETCMFSISPVVESDVRDDSLNEVVDEQIATEESVDEVAEEDVRPKPAARRTKA